MKLMIDGYLSGNGIGRCPHIKGVKVNSIIGPALIGKVSVSLIYYVQCLKFVAKVGFFFSHSCVLCCFLQDPTQQTAIVNFMVYGLIKTCAIKRWFKGNSCFMYLLNNERWVWLSWFFFCVQFRINVISFYLL